MNCIEYLVNLLKWISFLSMDCRNIQNLNLINEKSGPRH